MSALYQNHGLLFRYPEPWELTEEAGEGFVTITVTPGTSGFWSATILADRPEVTEVLESATNAYLETYDEVDIFDLSTEVARHPGEGRDIEFVCFELLRPERGDDRIRAGARSAGVRAGFESDVETGAAGEFAGFFECEHFGVLDALPGVEAAADDAAITDYDGADHRVGSGHADALAGEGERGAEARDAGTDDADALVERVLGHII